MIMYGDCPCRIKGLTTAGIAKKELLTSLGLAASKPMNTKVVGIVESALIP